MLGVFLLVAVVNLATGFGLAIVWTRNRGAPPGPVVESAPSAPVEGKSAAMITAEKTQEMLGQLRELADGMDGSVGEHNSRVAQINSDLEQSGDDGLVVRRSAAELVASNEQLHAALDEARQEIAAQQLQIEAMMAEARTDSLTGIANRRSFDLEVSWQCARWKRYGWPVSVIMADVDRFKDFNDEFGHPAGDVVLRAVAETLANSARDTDFVARYGGEEFGVILPGTLLGPAVATAERLRDAIAEQEVIHEGKSHRVTVSLGVTESLPSDDVASIVKRADQALYSAKRDGRNRAHFHDGDRCEHVDALRRSSSRYATNCSERIAPYVDGRVPAEAAFREVLLKDISATGFSYLAPSQPKHDKVLVTWGHASERFYKIATIRNCTLLSQGRKPVYRIGCEFTGMVANEEQRNTPPAAPVGDLTADANISIAAPE